MEYPKGSSVMCGYVVLAPFCEYEQINYLIYFFTSYSQLLDFEARAAEQVPLLMKMKRDQLALTKAIDSGDTDLGELLS